MKPNRLLNLMSAAGLTANLLFPGTVALAASPQTIESQPVNLPANLNALPGWFHPGRAATTAPVAAVLPDTTSALPGWFTTAQTPNATDAGAAGNVLPGWFRPPPKPQQTPIALSLLTVNVYGPPVASLDAPVGAGELYTAVIRNSSVVTAYSIFLTATHQAYFIYDGDDLVTYQSITNTTTYTPNVLAGPTTIAWTTVPTLTLAPGEVITLSFKLRTACDAVSGQQMRVGVNYNADPPPASPTEVNDGGLNITTGRGNLVIKKEPALQNLSTPDFGKPITWVVTVQNTGLGKIYGAVITDTGGISLSQPSGGLNPSATIPVLDVNQSVTFTVVGTVGACNFTNVAQGAWPCGNLVGDATYTNPVSSTVTVLFNPTIPRVTVQASAPITFPYCNALTRTVTLSITNSGGPAGNFRLNSNLPSNGFLQMITGSLSAGWQYAGGVFTYTGGSPTGTIPALTSAPVTLTFQVARLAPTCGAGGGDVVFTPVYADVCSGEQFDGNPTTLHYEYAQGAAPAVDVQKSGPAFVSSGQVFTYQITVAVQNPINLSGPVTVTDSVPAPFPLNGPLNASTGVASAAGQNITWVFTPTANYGTYTQTLTYPVMVTTTQAQCGASQRVSNNAVVTARPACPGCAVLTDTAYVQTVINNNEGIGVDRGYSGAGETCAAPGGFVIRNSFYLTGSYVITWTGAVFTDALGVDLGDGALPAGATPLEYVGGTLSVTVNGTNYTLSITPQIIGGNLQLDLSPLQAAGAPTQNVTLLITYTTYFTEGILYGATNPPYRQNFLDWSRLYLPGLSDANGCAVNRTFNEALPLTVERGDLEVDVEPTILNRCETNQAQINVTDHAPTRLADNLVITFTSSAAEIQSARNFTYTGALLNLTNAYGLPTVITNPSLGGGLGVITFTFPASADINGNGSILFDLNVNCTGTAGWRAGITYQTLCNISHGDTAERDHVYRAPKLMLFTTPLEYTVREKEVIWKFFIANNGNLTGTNVVVSNTLSGLAVFTYSANSGTGSITHNLPITGPQTAVFTFSQLAPGEQREVTVTAQVIACNPLHVDITAAQPCFGEICSLKQSAVRFTTPDPYLLTNNGQTADLPMCDLGNIVFRTKNASPDVALYHLDITETLRNILPDYTQPFTLTIVRANGSVITSTTAFSPQIDGDLTETHLRWLADNAPGGIFDSLEPLATVVITVPVRTGCTGTTPQAFAAAGARAPCDKFLSYTENAVTLQTREPDMAITKQGKGPTGDYGDTVYAGPGDSVTWRIRVNNRNSTRSYVAHNVMLTDTWPSNFEYLASSSNYIGAIMEVLTASNTISWSLGDVAVGATYDFYITGTVTGTTCAATTINRTRLNYGCDIGCLSTLSPMDTANLDSTPNLDVTLSPGVLQTCAGDLPVTIRNYGAPAYSNTLTLTLPSGYVYSDVVGFTPGLTPTQIISTPAATPQFLWNAISGRAADTPYSELTMTVRIKNSAVSGGCPVDNNRPVTATLTYDNNAVCAAGGPYTDTFSTNLNVVAPTLQISKTPRTQTAGVGQAVTWTVTLTNTGAGIAEYLAITDVAGSNYTITAASNGAGIAGNIITWTPSDIAPGGVWTATVNAVMNTSGDNRNVVTATAGCATGCQTAIAVYTATTTLLQDFNKAPDIQTNTIGSLVVFTFTTTLPDEDALYERLTLTDSLPTGLGYVDSIFTGRFDTDASNQPITPTAIITPGWLAAGNTIWQLGDLPGAVQINGVITAVIQDIPANQSGVRRTNILSMTYTDDNQPYVYTDTSPVDILEPRLTLVKASLPPTSNTVGANQSVTYTVTITNWTNTYASPARDVLFTDTLPAWMSNTAPALNDITLNGATVSSSNYLTNYTPATQIFTITCTPAFSIPVGGRLIITYVATVNNNVGVGLDLTNTARAGYSTLAGVVAGERTYSTSVASTTVHTVRPSITKTVTASEMPTATLGSLVTYTVSIPNPVLTATVYNVVVTDIVDSRLTILSATTSGGASGAVTWASRNVTATFASIPHDTQAYLTVTAVLSAPLGAVAGNVITNQAWLTYTAATAVTRTAVVSTPVGEPRLTLVKASLPPTSNTVGANQSVTYTVTITNWTNTYASPARDVLFTDTLPAWMSNTAPALNDITLNGATVSSSNYLTNYTPATQIFTITCTPAFSIPVGGRLIITYVATVNNNVGVGLDLTNTARAGYSTLAGVVAGERTYSTSVASTTVHTVRPSITKTVTASEMPTATLGSLVTYTVSIPNPVLTATVYNVVVTDIVDSRLTILSATTSGGASGAVTWASRNVTATFASIPHDTQAYLTVTAVLSAPLGAVAGNVITNQAWLTYTAATAVTRTAVVSTPVGEPRLTLVKASLPPTSNTVGANQSVTYTVTITNSSAVTVTPAYDIVFTDTLPAWMSNSAPVFITSTINGAAVNAGDFVTNYTSATGVYTIAFTPAFSIPVGGRLIITYVATVNNDVGVGLDLTNTARAGYSTLAGVVAGERTYSTSVASTTVHTVRPSITKTVTASEMPTATLGSLVTYTVSIPNPVLTATVYNVVVTDIVDSRLTILSATTSGGASGAVTWASRNVTATFASIPHDTQAYLTVTAVLSAPLGAVAGNVITNQAWLTYTAATAVTRTAVVSTPVGEPRLTLVKASLPPTSNTVGANQSVTYTVTITNSSAVTVTPAYDMVLTDTLSNWMNNATPSLITPTLNGALVANSDFFTGYASATGVFTLAFTPAFSIPVNGRLVITYVAQVNNNVSVGLDLSNLITATWSSLPGATPGDRNYGPITGTTILHTVRPAIYKDVTASEMPTATLGSLITYTIRVPNPALTATVYNVVVTDTLSPRLTILSATTAGGTGGAASWFSRTITGTFTSIPHDTQAYITVTAVISSPLGAVAGNVITNQAWLTYSMASAITSTNVVSTPVGEPRLTLVKASLPPTSNTVGAGQNITYTVNITNSSGITVTPAYDVVFTDTLPNGMRAGTPTIAGLLLNSTPVSSSDFATNYTSATGVFTITFTPAFSIPVGQALVIQYIAQVDADISAQLDLTNLAQAGWSSRPGATPGDRDYGPITGTTTVHTIRPPIFKSVTPVTATLGNLITYTLQVPAAPISATLSNVVVTDAVNSYLTIVTATTSSGIVPQVVGQNITATLGIITNGTQVFITITAVLSAPLGAVAGNVINNVAGLSHSNGITVSNQAVFTVTEPSLTLVKNSQPPTSSTVAAGQGVTYTVAITNATGAAVSAAYDVLFTDTLSLGLRNTPPNILAITLNGTPAPAGDYVTGYNGATGVLTVTFVPTFNIPVGGVLRFNYVTFVDADVAARLDLTNAAAVTWSSLGGAIPGDRNYGPLTGTTTVHAGQPALNLVKSAVPPLVAAGGYLTYTLAVSNTGVVSATGVVLTDIVPLNTSFVEASTPYTGPDALRIISWTLGTLNVGAAQMVTMVVQVNTPLTNVAVLTNTARVTCTQGISQTDTITTPINVRLSLGDLAWYDNNNNGIYEPGLGELPVVGVPVELYRAGDVLGIALPLSTTTTSATGRYLFTNLAAGGYFVHIPNSAFAFGQPLYGYLSTIPTQINPNTDTNEDVDENGVPNAWGVTSGIVTLTVGAEPLGDDVAGIDSGTPDNNSNLTVDFGFVRLVAIGNVVWFDTGVGFGGVANDGIQNGAEPGVANVTVELYQVGSPTPLLTTTTDATGRYQFDNLLPGSYVVHLPASNFQAGGPLAGYVSTIGNGADETSDQDVDENGIDQPNLPVNGITSTVYALTPLTERTGEDQSNYTGSLVDGSVNFTADFGFVELVAIGNLVWLDTGVGFGGVANDGIQNGTEPGVVSVTVTLYQAGSPTPLLTTTTDATGRYQFDNLLPGSYVVHLPASNFQAGGPLAGYVSTIGNGADETSDQDVDENGIDQPNLPVNGITSTVYALAPHTMRTGEDQSNYTGLLPDNCVNFTADFGFVELVAIGNLVWLDTGVGGGTANNGRQDGTEPGVANVTVELYQVGLPTPLLTTTTNATGRYQFDNLLPGNYMVHLPANNFQTGGPLAGYISTLGNGTDETSDQDVDENGIDQPNLPATGITSTLYVLVTNTMRTGEDQSNYTGLLPDNSVNFTADFGFYGLVSLGDQVWFDVNNDGRLNAGEVGVPNVDVELYQDTNGDNVFTPGVDQYLSSTTTTAGGWYSFTSLYPSLYFTQTYLVVITQTNFSGAGALVGYQNSAGSVGGNSDLNNRDHGVDGTLAANGWVAGTATTLTFGGEPITDGDTDSNSNLTIDFGFYRLELGNRVWLDTNNNGLQDGGETGVAGVTVTLYYSGGSTPLATTTTDASGWYTFTNLLSDTYQVAITPPAVYTSSTDIASSANPDNNVDLDDNGLLAGGGIRSNPVTLTPGNTGALGNTVVTLNTGTTANPTVDFGLVEFVAFGNLVWLDTGMGGGTANDGIQNGTEPGVPGVTVTLYYSGANPLTDAPLLTTTTNLIGQYQFDHLLPGSYFVHLPASEFQTGRPLAGYQSSTGSGLSDALDQDVDENGIDTPAPAVTGISSMVYTLIPHTLRSGEDQSNYTGTLPDNSVNFTADFGFYGLVSLGDQVWFDVNNDGRLNAGEVGVPNVDVELYQDTNGDNVFTPGVDQYLSSTTTTAGGWYSFTSLYPSLYFTQTYLVVITQTNFSGAGALVGYQNSAGSVGGNSDLNNRDHGVDGTLAANGWVAGTAVSLTVAGEPITDGDTDSNSNLTIDFGFYRLELGNRVWLDTNNNGLQDGGETGVAGVTVTLYYSGGVIPVATTTTDAGGWYTFTNLLSDTYQVAITPPAVYTSSTDIASSANPDNNVDLDDNGLLAGGGIRSNPVTLTPGNTGALGNTVVTLNTGTTANPTVDFGLVEFVAFGNLVWLDTGMGGGTANDGIQNGTEPGVPGVTVTLYYSGANPLTDAPLLTTTTNISGQYQFVNLLPGSYFVHLPASEFQTGRPLAGYQSSTGSGLSDALDQDVDENGIDTPAPAVTGISSMVYTLIPHTLRSGEDQSNYTGTLPDNSVNFTADFGFYGLVSLGDQVWFDVNNDGRLNAGEVGVPNVDVELYQDTNGDNVFTPGVDQYLSSTTTTAGGWYSFTSLYPSLYFTQTYLVVITQTNFSGAGALVGYQNSAGSVGGNSDLNNRDHGVDGTLAANGWVAGTAVSLTVAGEPITDGDTDSNSNLTIDFGFYRLELGNRVWLDTNNNGLQDGGETGVAGVTVTLYYSGGVIPVATTTTDAGGWYTFTNLLSDTYQVAITPPAVYTSSTDIASSANPDNNVDLDDNGLLAGGGIRSNPVTLTPGNTGALGNTVVTLNTGTTANPTVDFGLVEFVAFGNLVWLDTGMGGGTANDGIQNGTEPGVPGVTVTLYYSGANPLTDAPLLTTTTNLIGQYQFDHLLPGSYFVHLPASEFQTGRPLAGYQSSTGSGLSDALDQDVDENGIDTPAPAVTGISSMVYTLIPHTLRSGEDQSNYTGTLPDNSVNFTADFGFYGLVSLGDQVWFDVNNDGRLNAGEVGVPNVDVELYQDTNGDNVFTPGVDQYLSSTTTTAGGWYSFTSLYPSLYFTQTYLVVITQTNFSGAGALVGYQNSAGSVGGNSDLNNRDHGVDGTLAANGWVAGTAVSLTVAGEPITDGDTDSNSNLTIDFGFYRLELGNRVWLDTNNNGLQDGGETGVAGVTVTLYYSGGSTPLATTTTDAGGWYTFTNLLSDTYQVAITPPAVYTSSTDIASSANPDNNVDLDDNGLLAGGGIRSNPVTLTPGNTGALGNTVVTLNTGTTANPTVDFGLVEFVALGNLVWLDTGMGGGIANDGIQNGTEPGVPGVTVTLYYSGANPLTDAPLLTTTTNLIGQYQFDHLLPGSYFVHLPASEFQTGRPLAGYQSSTGSGLSDALDQDVDENGIDTPAPAVTGISSMVYTLIPHTLRSGEDQSNYTGTLPDNSVNFTADFGFVQLVAIGNLVWLDTGAGGGVANNGRRDGAELGVANVTVELYQAGSPTPLLTTTTNATGRYQFDNLVPGSYVVHLPASNFQAGGPLYGYVSSAGNGISQSADQDVDENGIDNPALATNGISSTLYMLTPHAMRTGEDQSNYTGTLDDASVNFTADFGFLELVAIGNFVWLDVNENGRFDSGETPVDGVTITLYYSGANPLTSAPLFTTTTAGGGGYVFDNLPPGQYFVFIPPANFQTSGVLQGYYSSLGNGTDETTDQTGDENGIDSRRPWTTGISSTVYTLQPHTEPITDTAGPNYTGPLPNDSVNFTADFGFENTTPTAVELLYFRVEKTEEQNVYLAWETAAEINNYGYNIYRAAVNDFAQAELIHFEPTAAAGGSGEGARYAYMDTTPANGQWWYWLVDVDTNGVETVHPLWQTTAMLRPASNLPFRLYLPFIINNATGNGP